MAQTNLRAATEAVERHPERPSAWGSTTTSSSAGARPPTRCTCPTTSVWACTRRTRTSSTHAIWDFEKHAARALPAAAALPLLRALPPQVVKQADLVLALHLRGDVFTDEQKRRDFEYYEAPDRARLVAVGLHAGDRGGGGRAPGASPTTTCARRRWSTSTTCTATARTGCTSPRWPARCSRSTQRAGRDARHRRRPAVPPAAARGAGAAGLRDLARREPPAGGGPAARGPLRGHRRAPGWTCATTTRRCTSGRGSRSCDRSRRCTACPVPASPPGARPRADPATGGRSPRDGAGACGPGRLRSPGALLAGLWLAAVAAIAVLQAAGDGPRTAALACSPRGWPTGRSGRC